ncbi:MULTISPECIES: K(+)-transporting ATPase subunit F [Streptococcus]|uniref:K+-transporting ATPase, F subunit n=1 Tax=Streptococcus pseudoporcinus LQ 940-04 TaxID=875093 RepID=G5KAR4_9STRE|nr:K+-transporting ATPase, F subunit [Streptococcus pseudoporcinus LQ 940-04]
MIILGIIFGFLISYLFYALLHPERF